MITQALGGALANISFGEFLLSLLIIFFMIVFFVILFHVVIDVFRDHELSGWAKAGWILVIAVFPYLGLFIYLIVRGPGMAVRQAEAAAKARTQMEDYIRETAGSGGGAATEIAKAKELLDSGAITQEEFETLKARHLG